MTVAIMNYVNVAGLKNRLSEFLGRVEAGESVVVCKRNVPIAVLRPLKGGDEVQEQGSEQTLAGAQGWLDDDDEFFDMVGKRRSQGAVGDPFRSENR